MIVNRIKVKLLNIIDSALSRAYSIITTGVPTAAIRLSTARITENPEEMFVVVTSLLSVSAKPMKQME